MTNDERRFKRAIKRFDKFTASAIGQTLSFDWLVTERNPSVLVVSNKGNDVTLAIFQDPNVYENVVAWALRMYKNNMF